MPKKKNLKESPEPGEGEQKQLPLSRKKRLKEIGSGLGWLLVAIALLTYGIFGLYTDNLLLLLPARGLGASVVHGPIAYVHFLFYLCLSVLLITFGLDYFSKQDKHAKRDKVFYVAGGGAIVFYILTFMMIHVWGPSGDLSSPKRFQLFGTYYHLHGPALWSLYLFFVCVTVIIFTTVITLGSISLTKKYEAISAISDKVRRVTWILMIVSLVATSVIVLTGGSDSKKATLANGIVYDEANFFKSVEKNDIESVKLFLSEGMDINALLDSRRYTALAVAAKKGHKDLMQFLIDRKADINKRGERGFTPLQAAALTSRDDRHDIACHDDIVLLLIKNGADVNAKTEDGGTALTMAAQVCPGVAHVLIENKADIHARTEYGDTVLLNAVGRTGYESVYNPVKHYKEDVLIQDSYDLVKYLLEHGADPNVKNSAGETPLRIAKSRRVKEVVQLLEQYHARE